MRIGDPVNVRRPGEEVKLENRVSIMTPMTAAKPTDVVERLKSIIAETRRIKKSAASQAIEQATSANSVPPAFLAAMGLISARQMEAAALFVKATNQSPPLRASMRRYWGSILWRSMCQDPKQPGI